jgi:hypothetical protein
MLQLTSTKILIMAAWLSMLLLAGWLLPLTTFTGWLTLAGAALLPFVLMARAWRQPSQTMSESIKAETHRPTL